MANITASMVKELREMTGAGMMECKKALAEAEGEMEKAVDVLRTRGLAAVAKKAGRATNEGTVMAIVNDACTTGAVVELNCETDFVGMNEKFKAYAEKIAKAALAAKPADVDALKAAVIDGETVEEIVTDCIHVMGENTQLARVAVVDAQAVSAYIHGGGKIGVLVTFNVEGIDPASDAFQKCGRDIAMQVAALNPVSATREDVPADVAAHEMEIYKAQAAESGKPEAIQEKIALGRMDKFYKENCLAEQDFVKNPDLTVAQYADECAKEMGGKIAITGFVRFALGEEPQLDGFISKRRKARAGARAFFYNRGTCEYLHDAGRSGVPAKGLEMNQEVIIVRGNHTLKGDVRVSGAKNSALKLMAASILGQGETILHNVPLISDIELMSEVLARLGATVVREGHTLRINTADVDSCETPYELVSKMRASISVLGPLIGRFGEARVAMPGGCQIGARKIDMHLVGLEALGVAFDVDHGVLAATTPNGLRGTHVYLEFPSVGATENMLMAAVTAEGHTAIENAACEPEIEDLANMLNAMGARVSGAGTSLIEIEGVPLSTLHPCEHTTVGDRIEAGTFLVGGALTGGPLTVHGIDPAFLRMAIMKLRAMGCDVETGDDWITVRREEPLSSVDIQTLPHPGFPTDLQAQFMLLAALADDVSVVTENVFENRFMFAAELMRMGADVTLDDHHAIVRGVDHLEGAPVSSTDLRAGAALVLAGIVADGETSVHHLEHIDRGYEDYVGKLASLGADIRRVSADSLR